MKELPCVRFVKLLDVRFASSITFLYLCSDETKMDSKTGIHEFLELKNEINIEWNGITY